MRDFIIKLLGGLTTKEAQEVVEGVANEIHGHYAYKPPQVRGFLSHIDVESKKYNL